MIPILYASLVLAMTLSAAATSVDWPTELYDPLVPTKVLATAQSPQNPMEYPEYTDRTVGDWTYFVPDTWTTGFFPATLYAMRERAVLCGWGSDNESEWLSLGRQWSTAEIPLETNNTLGHDVGFVSYPFVAELAVNPDNQTAYNAVVQFAADLAARFSPVVGCTRSWDTANPIDFEVIIDNMMNLEVLWVASYLTGNDTLQDIAISHANKTMINHIREDGGSFHVVEYNETTGDVIARFTSQGYSNSSTWSRGQAWGIYGFTNMYNHTRNPDYLTTARRMAAYFLDNLPDNGIVPWDFNAPLEPPRPADSSAAMATVNGLLFLSQMELSQSPSNTSGSNYYIEAAMQLLRNNTELAWRPSWQSLLANGTVNNPVGNNLTGIVYGDYFFVEAGNALINMGLATCDLEAAEDTASEIYASATSELGTDTSQVYATITSINDIPIVEVTSVGGAVITLATSVSGSTAEATVFGGHTFEIPSVSISVPASQASTTDSSQSSGVVIGAHDTTANKLAVVVVAIGVFVNLVIL